MRNALHTVLRGLALAAALGLAAASVEAGEPRLTTYVTQQGESCWSIAVKLWGDGKRYTVIHRHNRLGPMPHILAPGTRLRIPADAAKPDARLRTVVRDVKARSPASPDWRTARENQALWRLYRVSTGADSSADIRFRDASSLRMRERALLVIHGGASRRARLRRDVRTTVLLEKGTIRGGLASMDAEAGITVETPAAKVQVRAEEAQIEVAEDDSAAVCVYTGEAEVSSMGETVTVATDHGTTVARGERPKPPRRLPTPPRWADETRDTVVRFVPEGFGASFSARWQPVRRAARYRVELAKDTRFREPVVDAIVGGGIQEFRAEDLPAGLYHARLAAIDGARLESRPSSTLQLEVVALQPSRPLKFLGDGSYEAVGLLQLSPPQSRTGEVEVSIDEGAFVAATAPIRLVQPGRHVLRYRRAGDEQASPLTIHLLAVQGRLTVPEASLARAGEGLRIELALQDEKGRPAAVPGLHVLAKPGGELPLEVVGPGRYVATVPPPTHEDRFAEQASLSARWALGELDRAVLAIESALVPPPAPPPPFSWPTGPLSLEWPSAAAGAPPLGARPVTRIATTAFVGEARAADDKAIRLRSVLAGDLALAWRRVGLSLELPWFVGALSGGGANESDLGDLRLGLRYVALDRPSIAITPTLRVTVPSGTGGGGRDAWTTAVGFGLEWLPVHPLALTLDASMLLDAESGGTTNLLAAADLGFGVRPWKFLEIVAQLDLLVGLHEAHAVGTSLAAGGGLRFHIHRVRLGLVAGGALTDDARRTWGRFTAGVTAELGFRGL